MKLGQSHREQQRFLLDDVATEDRNYSFLYQLTHLAKRPRLVHPRDDRVDAVAGAVAHFQRAMMMDVDQAAKAMRDEEMLAEIEDFIEGFNQPTYRGMRVNGVRVATWSSQHGWSGDGRPEAEWLQ
jgi:hypothetical protein